MVSCLYYMHVHVVKHLTTVQKLTIFEVVLIPIMLIRYRFPLTWHFTAVLFYLTKHIKEREINKRWLILVFTPRVG